MQVWLIGSRRATIRLSNDRTTPSLRMKATTLFYDADCGICTACVDWLIRQAESAGAKLVVIAYQDEKQVEKHAVIDRRHADLGIQTLDSNGQVRRDAAAVATSLRVLPHWRWLGICMDWPLLKTAFQTGYRFVAKNRQTLSRLFGMQACRIPGGARKSDAVVPKWPRQHSVKLRAR